MSRRVYNGLDLQDQRIIRVGSPRDGTDAVNRDYVDDLITSQSWKPHVRVASTENVIVSVPGSIIDNITLAGGDRVLLKDQDDPTENGIYMFVSPGSPMVRSADANTSDTLIPSATVYVAEGQTHADTAWTMVTDAPITIGITELSWLRFGGPSVYQAGSGLALDGTEFEIDTQVVARKYTTIIGDGSTAEFAVAHRLGTRNTAVSVYLTDTGEEVLPDVYRTDDDTVTVIFRDPPSEGQYTVAVVG